MKIAFFWTPQFAADILSGILENKEIDTCLVVSQPDKPVGRKKELLTTPVKHVALDAGIDVLQPEKIRKNEDFSTSLKNLELDFIVVVAYGKIIPQSILDIPKYGSVNIHGSILPFYRGASPVQSAIKDGHTQTGLTTMYMSKKMDEGDILQIQKVEILPNDTSPKIFEKFVHIGPNLLLDTLTKIISWDLQSTPQNHNDATYCRMIAREDGHILFQKQTAQGIYNTYRAYQPWPGIYTYYYDKKLILELVSIWGTSEENSGKFLQIDKKTYGVVCADKKILLFDQVKLEWKKSMDVGSFVNWNNCIFNFTFN